jgi:hypothetical protein
VAIDIATNSAVINNRNGKQLNVKSTDNKAGVFRNH